MTTYDAPDPDDRSTGPPYPGPPWQNPALAPYGPRHAPMPSARRRALPWLAAAAGALIGFAIGLALAGGADDTLRASDAPASSAAVVTPTRTPTTSARPSATAAPALTLDGTYLVGKDIKPGKYRADNAADDCYWELDSADNEILDNGFGARPIMTITKDADTFTSQNCGTWEKIG